MQIQCSMWPQAHSNCLQCSCNSMCTSNVDVPLSNLLQPGSEPGHR